MTLFTIRAQRRIGEKLIEVDEVINSEMLAKSFWSKGDVLSSVYDQLMLELDEQEKVLLEQVTM